MKTAYAWMLAPWIAFGIAAWAGAEAEQGAEPTELQHAANARAWVLEQFQRNACRPGETAVWVADKEAACLREAAAAGLVARGLQP